MTARIGAPKTGGRKRGSIDREERKLLTDKMAADLMFCYSKLGGRNWLLEYAKANPREFIQFGLSRLWPAPQKDDVDFVQNNQFNFDGTNTVEAARRVCFALNAGLHAQQQLEQQGELIEAGITPEEAYPAPRWQSPDVVPDTPLLQPEPIADLDRERWVQELALTPEQRLDAAAIRETREASITNYHGSSAEQGHGPVQRQSSANAGKPTSAQLCRRLSRRGRELL